MFGVTCFERPVWPIQNASQSWQVNLYTPDLSNLSILSILLLINWEPKLLLLYKAGGIPYDIRVEANGEFNWLEMKGILLNICSVLDCNKCMWEIVNLRLILL